jgi:hypothetical protein
MLVSTAELMTRGEVRTTFALQATALSAQFNELFGTFKIPPGYVADLTAPDGPSTGGGVQALQHIRLRGPDGGPPLLMGSIDPSQMKAVVRTFRHLARQAAGRSGTLTLDEKAYDAFCDRVKKFYEGMHFVIEVEDAPLETKATSAPTVRAKPIVAPKAGAAGGGSSFWAGFIIGGVLFGAASAALMWFALTHH